MKKTYSKPLLICEELQPETMLCGCDVRNPTYSDLEMCSYTVSDEKLFLDFVLFGEKWTSCTTPNTIFQGTQMEYCYYGPAVTIFSS